jgi:tetratricopeptide (TPR) repeat protein
MKRIYTLFVMVLMGTFSLTGFAAGFESRSEPRVGAPTSDTNYVTAKQALEAKEWQKAIGYFNKAAASDPTNPDIQNYLGYARRNIGDYQGALKNYEKALELDPNHIGAHEYMGETYLKVNNLAKAEEHLAALNKICTVRCEQYTDLKKAIDEYKAQKKN